MENTQVTGEAAHGGGQAFDTKAIWRTFRVLLVITLVELVLAIGYYEINFQNAHFVKHLLNGVFIILTLTKAFYIIAEFMHLGHEIKNLILTLGLPAFLFVWFIGAFLWDGNSYKNLRNNYDSYQLDKSKQKVDRKEPEAEKARRNGIKTKRIILQFNVFAIPPSRRDDFLQVNKTSE